jgi:hypothetical protein
MEKITVLCASVKVREEQLKHVLKSIYEQVDEIHLVLNWYTEAPQWIKQNAKIKTYLNPENKNAHDAVWFRAIGLEALDQQLKTGRYYLIIDDDLLYPPDYVEKMIKAIERHERKAVITAHGANIVRPVKDYFECRSVYGFSDRLERDIFVDMVGVGVCGFHSSTLKPNPQDFPIPYCRDLQFSILAKKNSVPIVCLQRPKEWIRPLQTEGDTVYELTKTHEALKELKNRILKEQLLPLLFLDKECKDYVLMTDYDFDQRLVVNSLATLGDVCKSNNIIFSDKTKMYAPGNVLTQFVTEKERDIGRMGSKVLTQYRFMMGLPDGSQVISADCDLHYLSNPFSAFETLKMVSGELEEWDIAVTTRPYEYHYPINGGVVFFKINKNVRDLLSYLIAEVFDRTWFELQQYQRRFDRTPGDNDWYIDQDIWCCCWLYKNLIKERFGVNIIDVGPKYNFCPHADGVSTEDGKLLLMNAYESGAASILHLKSRLKELLFDGSLR